MTDKQIQHWVGWQRTEHRRGRRSPWQVRTIVRLIPGFDFSPYGDNRTYEEWAELARSLAVANFGWLPVKSELLRLGYGGMLGAIHNHPHLFEGLKRQGDWVTMPEFVAWCIQNNVRSKTEFHRVRKSIGRPGIPSYPAATYGAAWSGWGILSGRSRTAIDTHIQTAAQLTKQNGGALPCCAWLSKNGYNTIYQAQCRHPKRFSQFPQEIRDSWSRVVGFRNGTAAQRRALEIKHGLRPAPRKKAA